jgi:hypothetical protein
MHACKTYMNTHVYKRKHPHVPKYNQMHTCIRHRHNIDAYTRMCRHVCKLPPVPSISTCIIRMQIRRAHTYINRDMYTYIQKYTAHTHTCIRHMHTQNKRMHAMGIHSPVHVHQLPHVLHHTCTHMHTCTHIHTYINTQIHPYMHTYIDTNRRMDVMGIHSPVYVHELPQVPHYTC